jgi:hypothetical protein
MRNKIAIFVILLFFASMTLGKGISDFVSTPEIDYILKGSIQTSTGIPKIGAPVFFDLANSDTSFIERAFRSSTTNDSGQFNMELHNVVGSQTAVRIVVPNGNDTLKGPWMFSDSASRQEETELQTGNDCNARKRIVPVKETFTFPSQTFIIP